MFKVPVSQQSKQKILKYQIQMIEKCPESLFTQDNCQHHRYLGWQLGETLQRILQNYHYTFRWMGNEQNAYIYSYFYIAIISCSSHKSPMFQLKCIMYELSHKYLAQYQQKFLIQFLCLIQYSQDKFHFFRKYQKIEDILLKIFKQIQQRHPFYDKQPFRPLSKQQNPKSFATTVINSLSKSRQADFEKTQVLRNSDYYNSSIKKIEQKYRAELAQRLEKGGNKSNIHFISWYLVYNKIFNFMKMKVISDQNVKFEIEVEKKSQQCVEFIVTVQKDCFFVVQMSKLDKSKHTPRKDLSQLSRPCFAIEESKQYLNKLLERQIKENQLNRTNFDFAKSRNKQERFSFTPMFILDKKKLSWNNNNDLYSGDVTQKNIQIQILDLTQFKDNTEENINKPGTYDLSNSESYIGSQSKTIEYVNKITDLRSVGETILGIQENSILEDIKPHLQLNLYQNNTKNFGSIKESSYGKANRFQTRDQNNYEFSSQKCIPQTYAFPNQTFSRQNFNYFPETTLSAGNNYQGIDTKQPSHCSISQNIPTVKMNRDGRVILFNKISQASPNQIFLSAKNIKKRQNLVINFRKNSQMQDQKKRNCQKRQFHSHSPPQSIIRIKNKNFTPFHSPNKQISQQKEDNGSLYIPKIKFTYL